MDVHNAFLHGDLNEEVCMKIPLGYAKQGDNQVCHLNKFLYGLKQASWQWFAKLSYAIIGYGFSQSKLDYSLFLKVTNSSFIALLVYVNDIIIATNDLVAANELKTFLHSQFQIKDLGNLKYFLGLEIARSSKGISIC